MKPEQIDPKPFPSTFQPQNYTEAVDSPTIDIVRRPRGRPPGSKNRPKQPTIITQFSPSMSPYVLEIPNGLDIIKTLSAFSLRRDVTLCLLTASGSISDVTFRQPSSSTTVTFRGRFEILSLSGTFLTNKTAHSCPDLGGFAISLAGPQGQIVGGIVSGEVIASGTVYIVATSFDSPSFHRLPEENNTEESISERSGEDPSEMRGYGGDEVAWGTPVARQLQLPPY